MKKQQSKPPEETEQEADVWKGKYMRALADYQNLEKRSAERIDEVRRFATEIMLSRLLSFVDTFEKAKKHIKDPGLELAYKELMTILKEQGVEQMEVAGTSFDPSTMECIEVVDGKDNYVVAEVLPGYMFRGKVLRVAQVKVGKTNRVEH